MLEDSKSSVTAVKVVHLLHVYIDNNVMDTKLHSVGMASNNNLFADIWKRVSNAKYL